MKILFFIESLESGGKERRLVELLINLHKKTNFEMELVLTRKTIIFREILDIKIKIHIIERKFLKKDPQLFLKFLKIVQSFKPDLIHVWGNMVAIYAIPAKILLRIPMLNNQITDAPNKVPGGLLSHKIPFYFSDIIISNSKAGLNSYKSPAEKSIVINNGFDFSRISSLQSIQKIREKFSIKSAYVVGMIATFSRLKDYKTYIEAANLILRSRTDITFLCVGAGDDSKYKEMVESENKDKVIFTGRQNDVESIMNCCAIGVLSTFTEGISNSLMEFMALGKPVVATGGGGTSELIENGMSGLIIESGNPQLLAQKILSLVNDPKAMEEMGNQAKKRIETHFNIEKMVESFVSVYKYFDKENRNTKKKTISSLSNG